MSGEAERPGEFELIGRFLRPLANDPAAFGLTDDAASISPPPGCDLVLTKDMVAAGIHFFADDPAGSIARKALRVNLSDLAAKGAEPLAYLLGLALPSDWSVAWMEAFSEALAEDQARYGITLVGGDTVRASGGLTLSITAIGSVPKSGMVRRGGAKAGDLVVVTGTIGDAALGLRLRLGTIEPPQTGASHLLDRYLHPQPRSALAGAIRRYAHAALDVSDGLMGDLSHMTQASDVTAIVEAARVPLSAPARELAGRDETALASALTGGDDYEILAAVPDASLEAFEREAREVGIPLTVIGRIVDGAGPPRAIDGEGLAVPLGRASHDHF